MSRALYDRIAAAYAAHRTPDERIGKQIAASLRDCESVLNVGAGIGAYEPKHCAVVAVEPSRKMIRKRPRDAAPAVQAVAAQLPFENRSFDGALAVLTVHHWPNWRAGLAELRRVAEKRVAIVTWDPAHEGFWLVQDYLPEIRSIDRRIFPSVQDIESLLGPVTVETLLVPADCSDGFLGAYWRRPAEYLRASVRTAISTFSTIDSTAGIERLRRDLESGSWVERNRSLLERSELDIGYRLIVARCP
jgi:SAM-dependent methyltransferase